jgi:hypothetical protein
MLKKRKKLSFATFSKAFEGFVSQLHLGYTSRTQVQSEQGTQYVH